MASNWGWGNLWGGGNGKQTKESTKNAILGLRGTLDMLSKREKHLENQMNEQDQVARKNVASNKGGKSRQGHASTAAWPYEVDFAKDFKLTTRLCCSGKGGTSTKEGF